MCAVSAGTPVGRVVRVLRFPVKSMAAESLDTVDVSWFGLAGDRRWAFVRDEAVKSGFPWMTIRQRNDMNHFRPAFVDPDRPDRSATKVSTPSGQTFDVTDPRLAEELYSDGARVIKQNRGVFDTFPISLITTQTIDKLGDQVGMTLTPERFRPNIVVEALTDEPFQEDQWVGSILRIGDLRMRVDQRDSRCLVITVDPVTSERRPEVLRTVAKERDGCLGVYGSTVEPGAISTGNDVTLET